MCALAAWLPGTRDWSALRHPRCNANNPVKTVDSVVVRARQWGDTRLVQVDVRGDGFLRQMVRRLAGTLASVGSGWLSVEDAREAILAGRREDAGPCAPAHGLTLMRVEY
jgi:tRNA pseudouridine38-40 synthase